MPRPLFVTLPDLDPPAIPSRLHLSASGETSLTWSWRASPGAARYQIQTALGDTIPGAGDWTPTEPTPETTITAPTDGGKPSFTLTGLTSGQAAFARVRSVRDGREGELRSGWSDPLMGRTGP